LVGPSLDEARSSLVTTSQNVAALNDRTSKAIQELNDRAAAAWVNAGRELEQHISRIASDNGRVPQAMAPDATRLLSRIAASLDDFRPAKLSTAQLVALPSIGVFFGGAGLFGVYTLLRSGIVTWLLNLVGLG
jgi:hypothetical protein